MRNRGERNLSGRTVTRENLMTPNASPYLRGSTGETFLQGMARIDPRVYVEHASKRERDLIENAFKVELVERHAAKGDDGEFLRFKSPDEVNKALGDGWTLISLEYPIAWFRSETKYAEALEQVMNKADELGDEASAGAIQGIIDNLTDAQAKAFVAAHWGAMKRKGVAVPNEFFEYQKQLVQVTDPFNTAAARFYVRSMHKWRQAVLALMPRWAINTAIGSFVLNIVKGVTNPMDYVRGQRLNRTYRDPETGETMVRPGAIARRLGAEDIDMTRQVEKVQPPGVSIQEDALADMMETSMAGYQRSMDIKVPTERLVRGVQHIEDFFRRASFVHSIKLEARRKGRTDGEELDMVPDEDTFQSEGAQALQEMGDVLTEHYAQVVAKRGDVDAMLHDPELVRRAIEDVNKWGYNYGSLGPFERRYVRQFVPFWGWYKFISKLAYRLPVEAPARAVVLNALSTVGQDAAEELGLLPPWIRGSIILGTNPDGTIKYLPTLGMNPFGSFFNPLSPEGAIEGTLAPGQLAPAIQALMQGAGFDTLTGGPVRVSPQSGASLDALGRLVDETTGEPISAGEVQTVPRTLMALARTFPQYRLGEKYALEGGGSVFPEHIPFIQPRPMAPSSEAAPAIRDLVGPGSSDIGLAMLGALPRGYDLRNYQQLARKSAKYAQKRNRRSIRKLKRKLEK